MFFRLDFTADDTYTLSEATKDILSSLEEPVTVKAYFSENLPPELQKSQRDFQELLVEYAALSDGNVLYEFIDPSENEETERDAQMAGVPPMQVQVRKDDKFEAMRCYMGATIEMGEQTKEVIPTIQSGMPIEYLLSSAIKKLSVTDKPLIGIIQGHGEPSLASMEQARAQLSVLYNIEPIQMTDSTNNLGKYQALVLIGPKDSISPAQIAQIDNFVAQGKSMLIAVDRVLGDFQTAQGKAVNTGIESWLAEKGIDMPASFALDASCGTIGVMRQFGGMNLQQQVQFPYFPVLSNFNDHPASSGLEQLIFQFASPIYYTGDTTLTYTELIKTSEHSATQQAPIYFNVEKQWRQADFPQKHLTVAASLEGPISSSAISKLVVIGDGEFAINGEGRKSRQINPDNVNLLVNAVDWLSDKTGLIALRTKGVTSRPIDELEDGTKTMLKYLNFLAPLLLIIVYGIFRMQQKRNQRIRRMQSGYL